VGWFPPVKFHIYDKRGVYDTGPDQIWVCETCEDLWTGFWLYFADVWWSPTILGL